MKKQSHEIGEYLALLHELSQAGVQHFLEGGQAVNFWAEYIAAKEQGEMLSQLRPFTSKDCDLWVSHAAFRYFETRKSGSTLVKGKSPADGQLAIYRFQTSRSPEPLVVDLLTHVYGIPHTALQRVLARVVTVGNVSVIDPISLFQSKCHCLVGLDQSGRQDEHHVRILHALMPGHFRDALTDALTGQVVERALINEVKFLQKVLKQNLVRTALAALELNPEEMIPAEDLAHCGLGKVQNFAAHIKNPRGCYRSLLPSFHNGKERFEYRQVKR